MKVLDWSLAKTEEENPIRGVVSPSLTLLANLDSLTSRLPSQPTRTTFHTALPASHSRLNPKGRSAKELHLQIISVEAGTGAGDTTPRVTSADTQSSGWGTEYRKFWPNPPPQCNVQAPFCFMGLNDLNRVFKNVFATFSGINICYKK